MAFVSPPRLAYVAWLAICLIWGTTYLAIRVALETIPPTLLGGIRFVLAGAILCLVLRISGRELPPPRTWMRQALLGALLLGVGNGGVVWSELYIPSGLAAVNVASLPFWMAGSEAAMGGERISRRALIGLTVGFSGIVVLIWPSLFVPNINGRQFGLGVLLAQMACVGWAFGSSLSKRTQSTASGTAAGALQQLFAGLLLLAVGTALGEWDGLSFSRGSVIAQVYLIAVDRLFGVPVRPSAPADRDRVAVRVHQPGDRGSARCGVSG